MKVNNPETKRQAEYLKKLNYEQKHRIAAKEGEIESIGKIYDKKVEAAKLEGQHRLYEQYDRNDRDLAQSVEGKQEKLDELRTNLQKTKDRLSKEEVILKRNYQDRAGDVSQFYDEKYKKMYADGDEKTKEVNFKINEAVKDVEAQTQMALSEIGHKAKLTLDESQNQHQLKLIQASDAQAYEMKKADDQGAKAMARANMEHGRALNELRRANMNDITNRQAIHNTQMNQQKSHYSEILKGQEKAFEQKYKNMIAQHQATLEGLKGRLDKEVQAMQQHQAKIKDFHQARMNDEFYSMEELQPKVQETPNSYIVSIEIPAHEKDGVVLSVNKRKIKLTHSRRFEDRIDMPDGTVHKGGRTETFTKEFPVAKILDGKNITQKYENGMLSFKINKA